LHRVVAERIGLHVFAGLLAVRIAVDSSRRGKNKTRHVVAACGFEKRQRCREIILVHPDRTIERGLDGRYGTQMKDARAARKQLVEQTSITGVAYDQTDFATHISFYACREIIEDRDVRALGNERIDQVGANESGTACDKIFHA